MKSEKLADLKVKHLEMVQSVISRLAGQGATLKNYCITLITAVGGLAVSVERPCVILLALVPVTIFALLDAQYLRLERQFRSLFDVIRLQRWSAVPTFEINSSTAPASSYWKALFSWSIFIFYASLALAAVVVAIIAKEIYG